ncbi:hypothetical protein D3C71_1758770 [compost metagenome]
MHRDQHAEKKHPQQYTRAFKRSGSQVISNQGRYNQQTRYGKYRNIQAVEQIASYPLIPGFGVIFKPPFRRQSPGISEILLVILEGRNQHPNERISRNNQMSKQDDIQYYPGKGFFAEKS